MRAYTTEELCLIWLDSFLGLEYRHKRELFDQISDVKEIKAFIEDNRDYILTQIGESQYNTLINSANNIYLKYVVDGLEKRNVKALTILSDKYPEFLKQTSIPPLVLYLKGDERLLESDIFGIVGSRKNLPSQINTAKSFTESLVSSGLTMITGIAEGIDSAVIESALHANGKVISVIAGGFDNIYPKSNIELANKIAKNGLLISEYPPETVPKPYHFPVRNRIISALSKGVLVVSAGLKSGTMHTAYYAEEYGKHLFAVPYSIGVSTGEGCNKLIKSGAMLADSPEDILVVLDRIEVKKENNLTEEEKEIVELLSDGERHIEQIGIGLSKPVYQIMPILSQLEIKSVIVKNGSNVYALKR